MRRGERKRMPYENPERRRLNVMAIITQCQDTAELHWMTTRRHFGSVDLLHFLRELPPTPVPTVIVLDNSASTAPRTSALPEPTSGSDGSTSTTSRRTARS
jgi:hypothetical protein